jgi:chromosome segregation ATPase
MSVTAFFERLVGLQQQKTQTATVSYRELVAGIATGEEPNPAEVERLLSEAGKSVEDLRKDVETYQHRMELKAAVAAVPNLQTERHTLDEQIAAADRALQVAEDLHDEATSPLYIRRQQVVAAINEAERARHKLVATCDDPDLLREKEELEAEILKVHHRRLEQRERENFMDNNASRERQNAQCESWPVEADRRLDVAQQYQANGDATRRAIKDLDKELRKLEKRREEVEERMRKF